MNPKAKGEISQLIIMAELVKAGKIVLMPYGDNQRYDLVIDESGRFLRVQCKTGRMRDGAVMFNTCSSQSHRGKGKQNYRGQIEFFGVYCPDSDKCYLVPVDEIGITVGSLRVTSPKNNQSAGVRWANSYEL